VWQAVYDRLFLPFPLVAATALLGRIELARRWWAALSAGLAAACLVAGLPTARSRTTEHDEFRSLRPWIQAMPAGCQAFYVARAGRHVDLLPEYLLTPSAREAFVRVSDQDTVGVAPPAAGCVYVFHTSLCSTTEGAPLCRTLESRMPLRSLAQARVPARPSSVEWSYDGPEVPIRVLERCSAGEPSCASTLAE
jgi:hypothetical protein